MDSHSGVSFSYPWDWGNPAAVHSRGKTAEPMPEEPTELLPVAYSSYGSTSCCTSATHWRQREKSVYFRDTEMEPRGSPRAEITELKRPQASASGPFQRPSALAKAAARPGDLHSWTMKLTGSFFA